MRTRTLRLASLFVPALLALAAARPADAQPCTITCTSIALATDKRETPISFLLSVQGCERPSITCNPPNGSEFGLGKTTVTCSAQGQSGPPSICEFEVNLTPATDAGKTFTGKLVPNPNPGTIIPTGASYGQSDVFSQLGAASKRFLIFNDGEFVGAVDAQGFTPFNGAWGPTGVSFIGQTASGQYGTAQLDLCEGALPAVEIVPFANLKLDTSQGIFYLGNATGSFWWVTPADGKVFRQDGSADPVVFTLPSGARAQDVIVDTNAFVVLTTGKDGIFRISGTGEPPVFTELPFTPGSGTIARNGKYFVTHAFEAKASELTIDGKLTATYPLNAPGFRINFEPWGDLFDLETPRTFKDYNLTFGLNYGFQLPGTATITDFKSTPRAGATNVFLRDAAAGQSFVVRLEKDNRFDDFLQRSHAGRGYYYDGCLVQTGRR